MQASPVRSGYFVVLSISQEYPTELNIVDNLVNQTR